MMVQSHIDNLLSVQRRPTQSSIEILSITRLTNHVSILGDELRDTGVSDTSPFRSPLVAVLEPKNRKPLKTHYVIGFTKYVMGVGGVCDRWNSVMGRRFS